MPDDILDVIRKLRKQYYIHFGPTLIFGYRKNEKIVIHVIDPNMPIIELIKKDAQPYELEISTGKDSLDALRKDPQLTIVPLDS